MRRSVLVGAVIPLVALVAGCSASTRDDRPVDNSAEICRGTLAALRPYSGGDSPEFLAYEKALDNVYQGKGPTEAGRQAEAAYWSAMARDLRPFVDRATNPDLKKALRTQVEAAQRRAEGRSAQSADSDAVIRVSKICADADGDAG